MSFIKVKDPRKREELVRDFIETRKRIKDNFIARKVGEAEYQTGLTKLFKPVTETQKAATKEITDAQKTAAEKITKELLPIKAGIEGLPGAISFPTYPALETTEEKEEEEEEEEKKKTVLGKIATEYLKKIQGRKLTQTDIKPGDSGVSLFKIGNTPIEIKKNDIIINGVEYKGTNGLWDLLTSKNMPEKEVNDQELKDYINIMHAANTTRQGFNKANKRISGNFKMENLIKPLVKILEERGEEELNKIIDKKNIEQVEPKEKGGKGKGKGRGRKKRQEDPQPGTSGTGLKILPSDPNALIDRFDLLFSSKKAGHTGVKNEIVAILDELKRQGVINVQDYKKLNHLIKK